MARHLNTEKKIENVRNLTMQYYEAGNQAKCYKAVWRHYIYPVYPMCYCTYLRYINAVPDRRQIVDPRQQRLFD
ncbi:MAG: hypothetical protein R3Y59_02830 [bacterium]